MKKIYFFVIFCIVSSLPGVCFSEVIKLKNGQTIEGKIVERMDDRIAVDFHGVILPYYLSEIDSIDESETREPEKILSKEKKDGKPVSGRDPQEIFQSISPAVVYITTTTLLQEQALGSGFIVDSSGVVVTNYHVVQSSKEVNVKLKDGTTYPVTGIVHYDVKRDICVMKVDAFNLPTVELADSDSIKIGEKVYAIGNPLGLEYSFSDGILAGTRTLEGLKWLQFTSPISPGNSGGPMLNAKGQVLGIVTWFMSGGQNLNFALAINEIKPFISTTPKMNFQQFVESVSQADYYILMGDNYFWQGDMEGALGSYQQALQLNPECEDAYYKIGYIYNSVGQYQDAVDFCKKALALNSEDADALNELGFAYCSLGLFTDSLQYFEKAIRLNAESVSAYANMGYAYDSLGRHAEAIEYCQKALQLDPYFISAYVTMGFASKELGRDSDAVECFETAQTLSLQAGDYRKAQLLEQELKKIH